MDANRRLPQYLPILGFSLLLFSLFLQSCGDKEYREDYSFRNEMEFDIFLTVYSDSDLLNGINEKEIEIKSMSEELLLVNISDHYRKGAGADYFIRLADSVSVSKKNTNELIMFWRKDGEIFYANNYKMLRDFSGAWKYRNVENNYDLYYYLMILEEY
ncbi:hypothetical protein [Perlabentimonas gracilis]|jgi:hypothetical protein|uniref:hypothetical protein n=1 Tax=Perlabentimonas gracilis TaxID=2715279 RepID=UPI0014079022|nr:hypothetical protein [Perlabentimonas gracilis]NHB69544.1 hypothetical protein [Perlabentimonas gracilis]